ncbi:MAG TPA: hypothetical protein RMH99_04840 [Sandaracinaceae bacterium LLY-WYZ-13_1]|nr:hypothetical protein [Sandaracinaceae bacterium LLY-WYZ-13_1]
MSTEKLQHQYDALVTRFVAPLVSGGQALIEKPVAPGAISYFEHASPSDAHTEREIFDRLHRGASAIAPIETVPWPDRDLLLMAMAAYDLVHLTDPELDRVFARGARKKVARWIDEMIDAVAPPSTRADALARHALIDPLPALRRRDVVAKSWAYTYRFIGRPKNASLLTRPIFGTDFEETETFHDVVALLEKVDATASLHASEKVRALLARSPVTELLRLDICDTFRFGLATLAVLSDDAIRGGVARTIVERGEWKAAPRLGRALGDPILQHAPPAHLYFALALCFEVQMTATLDVPGPALPQRLDLSDPDTARYAAVLPAFFDDETMLDEVRAFDDGDRGVVQERCARLAAALPDGILDEIAPLVRRCQRPSSRASASTMEMHP